MTVYKTTDINLYHGDEGAEVIIQEDGDGLGMVQVKCESEYFGAINFSMDTEMATELANAILQQVQFIKEAGR